MTRGHPPTVAIGEARQAAASRGCPVLAVSTGGSILPFDFVIYDQGKIILVRVRRLRYTGYEVADIEVSCSTEIAELRAMTVPPEISRQLHVRGPDRHWHRYFVLPDTIEEIREEEEVQARQVQCRSPPDSIPPDPQTPGTSPR